MTKDESVNVLCLEKARQLPISTEQLGILWWWRWCVVVACVVAWRWCVVVVGARVKTEIDRERFLFYFK